MSIVLLIDYENVQGINLEELAGTDSRVCIFTGSSQSKIPIEARKFSPGPWQPTGVDKN